MVRLDDRVAVVTGGSRGIGRAIAETLSLAGASVVIAGRGPEDLEEAVAALGGGQREGEARSAMGIVCDVRNHEDCRRLVSQTVAVFGRLDILINNAGVGAFAPVAEMDPETWDTVIDTNLSGMFYCTHEAIPHLKAVSGGWIINIGSLAGKNAFPNGAAYNASKFGLIGFSEALMQEVRYDDIRVSYIMPGSVATGFSGRDATRDDWRIAPEDVARAVLDLLAYPGRSLPSRIELRPSKPPRRQ